MTPHTRGSCGSELPAAEADAGGGQQPPPARSRPRYLISRTDEEPTEAVDPSTSESAQPNYIAQWDRAVDSLLCCVLHY